jgi:Tfp pilus assembly protein PilF
LDRLEEEHDNMRAALSWALDHREAEIALRLGGALRWFWNMKGYYSEGRSWLAAALTSDGGASALSRAKTLEGLGWLANQQGDLDRAEAIAEDGLRTSGMYWGMLPDRGVTTSGRPSCWRKV